MLFETGDYEECIALCEKAVELGRTHRADFKLMARALARIGSCYHKQGRLEEAISFFGKSLADFRAPEIVKKLQEVEKEKKERDARAYIDPELAVKEKERGNELFRGGKFADAVAAYTEAIKRDPSEATYYSNRSAAYSKLMEFKLALDDADKCIAMKPDYAKAYARKGNAHIGLKELHKAMDAFEKGLQMDAKNPEFQEGVNKVRMAIARDNYSGEVDKERQARAMADPEIQSILRDPMFNEVLRSMQENPASAGTYLKDPEISAKVQKLIAAGVLQTR